MVWGWDRTHRCVYRQQRPTISFYPRDLPVEETSGATIEAGVSSYDARFRRVETIICEGILPLQPARHRMPPRVDGRDALIRRHGDAEVQHDGPFNACACREIVDVPVVGSRLDGLWQ